MASVDEGKRSLRWRAVLIGLAVCVPYVVGAVFVYREWGGRPTFIISSGNKGGLYFDLGKELEGVLNEGFEGSAAFKNESSRGSNENLERLEKGSAALALAQDGIERTAHVRALARLYNSPYQLVVRADRAVSDVSDLVSRSGPRMRVFFGVEGSGTWTISEKILQQYGLSFIDFDVQGKDWSFEVASKALQAGRIDAAAFLVGFGAPALNELAAADPNHPFTLVPIKRAAGLVTTYPYLEQFSIPAGSYRSKGLFPADQVVTIATRELLVAGEAISERTAYRIVDTLFSSSTKVVAHFPLLTSLSRIEPERNFYYPLHAGASAYYRRDSQPSAFGADKIVGYLGYSATLLTFALVAIRRRRVKSILDRIDVADARVTNARTTQELADLRAELQQIEAAAFELHRKYKIKDDNYSVAKEAIRLCRRRLTNRFAALPAPAAVELDVRRVS
jgi:TRAP transporter TAXI family solute receptor